MITRRQPGARPGPAGGWAGPRRDSLLAPLIAGLAAFVLLGMMVNVGPGRRPQRGLGGLAAAGAALTAVLAPRQVYLLAGGLGCLVTVMLAARLRRGWARHTDISFVTEQSPA